MDFKSRQLEKDKFREPKAVYLYLNWLFCFLKEIPPPISDTGTWTDSSIHSCAVQWIANVCVCGSSPWKGICHPLSQNWVPCQPGETASGGKGWKIVEKISTRPAHVLPWTYLAFSCLCLVAYSSSCVLSWTHISFLLPPAVFLTKFLSIKTIFLHLGKQKNSSCDKIPALSI